MITDQKKGEIVAAMQRESDKLGSMRKVSEKLGINPGHISANFMKPANWGNVSDTKWTDVAAALGVSLVSRGWNLVPTTNLRIMHITLDDAQREAMFMAVSEKAGSGKSGAIAAYLAKDLNNSVYAIQCEEWSRKGFLMRLAKELGVTTSRYDSAETLTEGIVRFFKQRSKEVAPLLILDEADKLKPAAKRFLIPLYNRLEDEIGLVACGTENLEKEIKAGVRKAEKGYDEIDSRLGRNFVHLIGSTLDDVAAICFANGVTAPDAINRVFENSNPEYKQVRGAFVNLVSDMRAVKRAIKAERIKMARSA